MHIAHIDNEQRNQFAKWHKLFLFRIFILILIRAVVVVVVVVLVIFFSYPIYLLFLVIIKCDASVFYRLPAGFSVHLPRNENRCVLELRLTENNTQLITKNNENIKVTSVVVVRSLFCSLLDNGSVLLLVLLVLLLLL